MIPANREVDEEYERYRPKSDLSSHETVELAHEALGKPGRLVEAMVDVLKILARSWTNGRPAKYAVFQHRFRGLQRIVQRRAEHL
jgi:hypothetical protein